MDGRKGAETEPLTDLLSWTFPAESHLSETLLPPPPAVGGHGPPDKERHRTEAEERVCSRGAGRRRAAVHTRISLRRTLTCTCLLCSSMCAQIQAMRRISSNYGP